MVGPEGMEKFCEDIGVEPENVRFIFLFFWPGGGYSDGSCNTLFSLVACDAYS